MMLTIKKNYIYQTIKNMKSYKNLFTAFLILMTSFAIVLAKDKDKDEGGIGEIIGDIIAFIIGEMIGSCLTNTECASFLAPLLLKVIVVIFIISIILSCCGYKSNSNSRGISKRRSTAFAAGMGWGAAKGILK